MAFGIDDALMIGGTLLPMLFGGKKQQAPQSQELEQLLGMQRRRMQQSDPLYQAILQMAMGLMPGGAGGGMGLPGGMGMPTRQTREDRMDMRQGPGGF